jgi:hypothetical protein
MLSFKQIFLMISGGVKMAVKNLTVKFNGGMSIRTALLRITQIPCVAAAERLYPEWVEEIDPELARLYVVKTYLRPTEGLLSALRRDPSIDSVYS